MLPDAVVLPFERPTEHVATDILWLASPQDAAYVVLAMQVGGLQLRAFAPLSDSRVAEWAREIRRRVQFNLAVEVESPRRLAVFEARCTSPSEDAIEQALNSSRGLSREERARDLVQATNRICMPSAVPDLIPEQSPKELYVNAVESAALKEAFIHFGLADGPSD